MSEQIEIFEVGPRDGLQNEKRMIPASEKIALIDLLSRAGFRRIEVASFVSPKWVPQMADGAEVLAGLARAPGVSYAALTPNIKGYERARAARADEVAIFVSASEGFSKANLNATIIESLERFSPVVAAARADDVPVRGYVSCVTDCPFDGPTAPGDVAAVVAAMQAFGCYEVSLGDTIGRGTPEAVDAMLDAVLDEIGADQLAGHFHDTAGRALANVDVALARGLRVFDAAVGGLGGCPYAPGSAGNVATEAVMTHVAAAGFETGLNPEIVAQAAAMAKEMRG
ncbi:MAG: hydroxymethylglutaryl-CoA lyase [Jannaschia helgolandensis]|jgi:hydroxymethylglutaryl-CoA lyase|uniref:hydroxymethylglutaryl-CoA lyase n=1 Tax=Jannaschia helgolandensis TaxID=188906 RepID=UPI003C72781D